MNEQNDIKVPGFKYKPTPNAETYKEVTEVIRQNDNYCCCEIDKTDDTKCICSAFKESLAKGEETECNCGKYKIIKVED